MKTSLFFLAIGLILVTGCATHKVERVSPNEQIDLSGRWNDTDSRLVAEEMVNQIMNAAWVENHLKNNGGKAPVVVVGLVYNKSHEHISSETFIKDIERAFINSGRVRLVQAGDKREELRRERAGQQEFASLETAKRWGLEVGADYMLNGDISSITDEYKRERVIFYQINLELSNLETNEIIWIGDKKIKKDVNK